MKTVSQHPDFHEAWETLQRKMGHVLSHAHHATPQEFMKSCDEACECIDTLRNLGTVVSFEKDPHDSLMAELQKVQIETSERVVCEHLAKKGLPNEVR